MTTHVAAINGANYRNMTLLVTSGQIRVARVRVESDIDYQTPLQLTVTRVVGASLSGGTAFTPAPSRQGAPGTTVTARRDGSVTGSATELLGYEYGPPNGTSNMHHVLTWQPSFDSLISAGSALRVVMAGANGSTAIGILSVHYDEIRQISVAL